MRNISDIDKNFQVNTNIKKDNIKFYNIKEEPFKIYGVNPENGKYRRMSQSVAQKVSDGVYSLHSNTSGGRVRFITDSSYIAIHANVDNIGRMPHFALTGSAGFDLYSGTGFVKTFIPPYDVNNNYESIIEFGTKEQREITINFPLYSDVLDVYVGVSDDAVITEPKPYINNKPIVYYGSSITQGGCASRPGMSYPSIVSRKLNCDYINLGFSGNAKAEDEIAEYIKNLDMSIFVYDYDYNSPSTEHLKDTHKRMFQTIRNANPNIPIIIMSRPEYSITKEETERLSIIKETYETAISAGDKNVYFLDGKKLMHLAGDDGTVDGCHPNDYGFVSMANAITDVILNNNLICVTVSA